MALAPALHRRGRDEPRGRLGRRDRRLVVVAGEEIADLVQQALVIVLALPRARGLAPLLLAPRRLGELLDLVGGERHRAREPPGVRRADPHPPFELARVGPTPLLARGRREAGALTDLTIQRAGRRAQLPLQRGGRRPVEPDVFLDACQLVAHRPSTYEAQARPTRAEGPNFALGPGLNCRGLEPRARIVGADLGHLRDDERRAGAQVAKRSLGGGGREPRVREPRRELADGDDVRVLVPARIALDDHRAIDVGERALALAVGIAREAAARTPAPDRRVRERPYRIVGRGSSPRPADPPRAQGVGRGRPEPPRAPPG